MAYLRVNQSFRPLDEETLAAWRLIPPAVASDCMNRTQTMGASIKPIASGMTLCGQARTVSVMVGDCASICELISTANPGEVVVVDAGGFEDTAVWGGIMTTEASRRGLGGAIVYGAVRDIQDIRNLNFSMFCSAVVPKGPHHGFGGTIDGQIGIKSTTIRPGDIVLGNDDGVVVVPLEIAGDVLSAAQEHLKKEEVYIEGIKNGKTIMELYKMDFAELIEPRA